MKIRIVKDYYCRIYIRNLMKKFYELKKKGEFMNAKLILRDISNLSRNLLNNDETTLIQDVIRKKSDLLNFKLAKKKIKEGDFLGEKNIRKALNLYEKARKFANEIQDEAKKKRILKEISNLISQISERPKT